MLSGRANKFARPRIIILSTYSLIYNLKKVNVLSYRKNFKVIATFCKNKRV